MLCGVLLQIQLLIHDYNDVIIKYNLSFMYNTIYQSQSISSILSYFYTVTKCVFRLKKRSSFSAVKNSVCNIYQQQFHNVWFSKHYCYHTKINYKHDNAYCDVRVRTTSNLFFGTRRRFFATFWINYYKKITSFLIHTEGVNISETLQNQYSPEIMKTKHVSQDNMHIHGLPCLSFRNDSVYKVCHVSIQVPLNTSGGHLICIVVYWSNLTVASTFSYCKIRITLECSYQLQ